jgi:sugar phosphate isomerase/epimerase
LQSERKMKAGNDFNEWSSSMAGIDRREFLISAAALTAGSIAKVGEAQGKSGSSVAAATAPSPTKIRIDAYSRTLQWLRTPEEVAEACHQIGNSTIDLTVRTYPGHVDPAKVVTDLPPFVKTLEKNGVTVTNIGADIVDSKTPYIEEILGTAASLGVRYNWWRGFSFDSTKPYPPQIETLKPRLEALAKIQEKYGMKAMYHPQGGPFFDQLELIRNFDPRYVSLHYDTSHWLQVSNANMAAMIMLAAPYIGGFVWKDGVVEKRDPAAVAAVEDGGGQGGRSGGNVPAPAGATGGAGSPQSVAGRGAGPGGGRGPGGGGGRGGSYNGWGTAQVPVGSGMVDFTLAARTLKLISFDGPTECQPEWAGLGGAESGRDTLTLPRETVIALLKHDYDTIYASLSAAGVT